MTSVAVVLAVVWWKNQQIYPGVYAALGEYGWPQRWVELIYYPVGSKLTGEHFEVISGQGLRFDAFVAVAWLAATWIVFSRTQRRCQRWWQFSMATLFAFVTLTAVVPG